MRTSYILIILLAGAAVFGSIYSSGKTSSPGTAPTELILRKIGHELLLSAGDGTSRVMPVKKISEQHYRVYFENAVAISNDSLIRIVNNSFAGNQASKDYSIDVVNCQSSETVYSFAVQNKGKDSIIPCNGRALPKSCYYLDIQFGPEKNIVSNNSLLTGGILVAGLLLLGVLMLQKKNKTKTEEEPATEDSPEEPTPATDNYVQIGKYRFNAEKHYLELDGSRIILTNKESKLLHIFSGAVNDIITREHLQKEVWENEGVIVTRSLDMFVSKLRKKLQGDEQVKIVNFPGKGYMLEVNSGLVE